MDKLDTILEKESISEKINLLKERVVNPYDWEVLKKDYEPELHYIVNDKQGRRDKVHSDGTKDEAARLSIGLEKLLSKRITEFTFAIPVKRIYSNTDTPVRKEIANAIENIYEVAHIDSENIKRGLCYYASCEALTIWYTKRHENNLYGFNSKFKLKCKTFSPMDGVKLYPLFDEKDDLVAISFEYQKKFTTKEVTFFETFTANKHFEWKMEDGEDWQTLINGDEIIINKIPGSYIFRDKPCWDGLSVLRQNIEYTISRNSDVIAYNAAPILKVCGTLIGDEHKGDSRRMYRVSEGGDISYVSWQQSIDALKYHVDTLVKLFFMQSQMPDISFENLKSLGNIGYESRKTLLADAHLKIGEESGAWIEFFERENNVIKAFLKKMNTSWKEDDVDAISVEHVITPFIQEDEANEIDKWQKASGGKALVSHIEAIKNANLTSDPEQTLKLIQEDEAREAENRATRMNNLFSAE